MYHLVFFSLALIALQPCISAPVNHPNTLDKVDSVKLSNIHYRVRNLAPEVMCSAYSEYLYLIFGDQSARLSFDQAIREIQSRPNRPKPDPLLDSLCRCREMLELADQEADVKIDTIVEERSSNHQLEDQMFAAQPSFSQQLFEAKQFTPHQVRSHQTAVEETAQDELDWKRRVNLEQSLRRNQYKPTELKQLWSARELSNWPRHNFDKIPANQRPINSLMIIASILGQLVTKHNEQFADVRFYKYYKVLFYEGRLTLPRIKQLVAEPVKRKDIQEFKLVLRDTGRFNTMRFIATNIIVRHGLRAPIDAKAFARDVLVYVTYRRDLDAGSLAVLSVPRYRTHKSLQQLFLDDDQRQQAVGWPMQMDVEIPRAGGARDISVEIYGEPLFDPSVDRVLQETAEIESARSSSSETESFISADSSEFESTESELIRRDDAQSGDVTTNELESTEHMSSDDELLLETAPEDESEEANQDTGIESVDWSNLEIPVSIMSNLSEQPEVAEIHGMSEIHELAVTPEPPIPSSSASTLGIYSPSIGLTLPPSEIRPAVGKSGVRSMRRSRNINRLIERLNID